MPGAISVNQLCCAAIVSDLFVAMTKYFGNKGRLTLAHNVKGFNHSWMLLLLLDLEHHGRAKRFTLWFLGSRQKGRNGQGQGVFQKHTSVTYFSQPASTFTVSIIMSSNHALINRSILLMTEFIS